MFRKRTYLSWTVHNMDNGPRFSCPQCDEKFVMSVVSTICHVCCMHVNTAFYLKIKPIKCEMCKNSHLQEKSWATEIFIQGKRCKQRLLSLREVIQKQMGPLIARTRARRQSSLPLHQAFCTFRIQQPKEASSQEIPCAIRWHKMFASCTKCSLQCLTHISNFNVSSSTDACSSCKVDSEQKAK